MKTYSTILMTCFAFAILLGGCAVGPEYHRADLSDITPADWKWKEASPERSETPKGKWWSVFNDPKLDELEMLATSRNPSLQAAVARVDKARAQARISRSQFFPDVSFDPSYRRQKSSADNPTPMRVPFPQTSNYYSSYSLPIDLSYELDIWGKVRRSFEAAQAQAKASAADYENIMLTLTSDVAVNYYLLRTLDSEVLNLNDIVKLHENNISILSGQVAAGTLAAPEVEIAKAEHAKAKADLTDKLRQREELVHALALLCGQPVSLFTINADPLAGEPPKIPSGLPSDILERRPDIAQAESLLKAQNAQIGVAKAAYFPSISLTGQAGFLSADIEKLFRTDSLVWSLGPSVSLPIFNYGRTKSQVEQAEAAYHEAISNYRQSVLIAFKEVEDSLVQIEMRKKQHEELQTAIESSRKASMLLQARHKAGLIDRLPVIDSQQATLQCQRQQSQIMGQRYVACVRLMKSLGGDWEQNVRE